MRAIPDFPGTRRYIVRRPLGAGGMGVVYEAYDTERAATVALKTLKHQDGQALYRFKNEFRSLADLRHRNLVSLGELCCEGGRWFFTMEYVPGDDFLRYVRGLAPSPSDSTSSGDTLRTDGASGYDLARLRDALRQLALGLQALHQAGKVHRDVKPSNVVVTEGGRLVLLDFGLVAETTGDGRTTGGGIVGTPVYMAPEQAEGGPVTPAADWYALGALLYEALAGKAPYAGSSIQVILAKQQLEPPPLPQEAPPDLARLCVDLMRADPRARPGGAEVLERLGHEGPAQERAASEPKAPPTPVFVGRERELALLEEAAQAARGGKAVLVLVRGESGIGKSALVRRFAEGLPRAVLLAGRCYERESLPYKALDGAIDALTRHLLRMDPVDAAMLLPRDTALLARLFPVLERIPAVSRAPLPRTEAQDPHVARARAFSALRELFSKLADRALVLLAIDDLQWADPDSHTLIQELFALPDPPPILLLATSRASPGVSLPGDVRAIDLAPLSEEDAAALARELSGGAVDAAQVAREAAGHPLFVRELTLHAAGGGGGAQGAPLRLDDALLARVLRLEPRERRLLEVLAVAGVPLDAASAARAAELESGETFDCAARLRSLQLVRGASARGAAAIEPYHDRLRETLLARMGEAARRAHHGQIARALLAEGAAEKDPQALVRHLEAAGESAQAAACAEKAGRRAATSLAFEQAGELFQAALRLGRHDREGARSLELSLAHAFSGAGKCVEAAEAFLAAAEGAGTALRLDCRRRAAEHLLGAGVLERGLLVLALVLAELQEALPKTQLRALISLGWQRLKLRLRGTRARLKDESEIAPALLQRLDALKAVSIGVGRIDFIRGADFQARALLLALRTGERKRLATSLVLEAIFASAPGRKAEARARGLLAEAARVAGEMDPLLLAYERCGAGTVAYMTGRFAEAEGALLEAERLFRDKTIGMAWEVSHTRVLRLFTLMWRGRFQELARSLVLYRRDAARRGDRYLDASLARMFGWVALLRDDRAGALQALSEGAWAAPEGGYHLQHWYELVSRSFIALHDEDRRGVYARWQPSFAALKSAFLLGVETIRTVADILQGLLALADAETAPDARPLLKAAARHVRRLEGERVEYARCWALLLRAGLLAREGRRLEAERRLQSAIETADAEGLPQLAAAAAYRLGELRGGPAGEALLARAQRWADEEGILNHARAIALLAPSVR